MACWYSLGVKLGATGVLSTAAFSLVDGMS
jgi:hypothetical protein